MSHPQPTLSPQAEKVICAGFAGGLLGLLAFAFLVAGAPVPVAVMPVALAGALIAVVGRAVRHVVRHGWHNPPADGPSGRDGDSDPRDPNPQLPSGDAIDPEWDRFLAEFWAYVEREREFVGT